MEPSSAEKLLAEEKAKLEEQLKDVTVSVSGLLGCTSYKLCAQEPALWILNVQSGYVTPVQLYKIQNLLISLNLRVHVLQDLGCIPGPKLRSWIISFLFLYGNGPFPA